jgi:hypothetical protein
MGDDINNIDLFDRAMHDAGNNFSNILYEIDPDMQMRMNIPVCQIIPGDELSLHSNSLLNNFSCMSLNVASLKENYTSLQVNITDHFSPTVLGLCETKLTDELQDLYNLPGYNLFTNNNMSNKGGVCLFINNRLTVVPKPELSFIRPGIETIFVDIFSDNEIKTVGMIYRRATEISIEHFSEVMNEIFSGIDVAHNKVYVMGDFNVDLLQYHRRIPVANYCNNFFSHGLYPVISKPTRTTAFSATLIDNIFTNDVDSITRAAVIISDVSDHYPIFIQKLNSQNNRNPVFITYRKFNDQNIQNFKEALGSYDFNGVISTENSNDAFSLFHSVIIELFEEHFPLITKELRHKQAKNPWMTPGLLVSKKKTKTDYTDASRDIP